MARQIASVPPSVAALPFLFARPQQDADWNYRLALLAAVAAERADDSRRNTPGRVAYLLCEVAFQIAHRRMDPGAALPVSRQDIADALGVSLSRVKRTLALLSLSGVVECDGNSIRVKDWARLCSAGWYAPTRLQLGRTEDELDLDELVAGRPERIEPQLLTRAGEPACFV